MGRTPARRLQDAARDAFGWEGLRPGQLEAMTAVLEGRDTLAVMPTGHGKSAVYQVPALLLDGPTVVVSLKVSGPTLPAERTAREPVLPEVNTVSELVVVHP